MPAGPSTTPVSSSGRERELWVEDVAERLGVPVAMLVRRIEAGDVPALRVDSPAGPRYRLRFSDLGFAENAVEIPDEPPHEDGLEGSPQPVPAAMGTSLHVLEDPRCLVELAGTFMDPRELVAGVLERWEQTLEERIRAEQQQRFEAELSGCRSQIRQLQLELEAVRSLQGAEVADRDRIIADQARALTEADRQLHLLRDRADAAPDEPRGWFLRRY
jgi:hypothetical protein